MTDSRAIDQESRRRIREELLDEHPRRGRRRIGQDADARRADGCRRRGRRLPGRAHGGGHVHPQGRVGAARPLPPGAREASWSMARAASPGSRGSERIARLQSALSNLERFFAGTIHSFCARLLRERPVESGVSPGFTELDEVQDLELRQRAWRDFITSARAAGDPDMMALLEADIRPKDLDSAFATICENEDVEFPPGDGACPDPKPAWKALEKFWKELQKHLPSTIDPDTTCPIQKAAGTFRGQMRVSRHRLERPAVIASLLDTWDCESRITQKWWADSPAEKKRLRDLIEAAASTTFCTDVVEPYLAQWRQYVYRLVGHAADARARHRPRPSGAA